MFVFWFLFFFLLNVVPAWASDFTGEFKGRTEDGPVVLSLKQGAEGRVTGSIVQDGVATPVSGHAEGNRLTATGQSGGRSIPFTATLKGNQLSLSVMGTTVLLTRTGQGSRTPQKSTKSLSSEAKSSQSVRVKVNGVELDDNLMRTIEQKHKIRFIPGDFWYDRRCGAWGAVGGPTLGFVAPGIEMGGELRRDASGGNTGVIINGRELHEVEVAALRQLGPVFKGRYWLDWQGNYGFEGGPALGNLVSAAQSRQQVRREGILSTWDRTGVAVFGY